MDLPPAAPVMILPNATLFPRALLPLFIFETRYSRMLKDALAGSRMFIVAMQRPDRVRPAPCQVAGLGFIRAAVTHPNGTSHLVLEGMARVELGKAAQTKPYRVHPIRALKAKPADADNVEVDALMAKVHELAAERLKLGANGLPPLAAPLPPPSQKKGDLASLADPAEILNFFRTVDNPDMVADFISCALLADANERQTILETVTVATRLRRLIKFLLAEIRRTHDHT